MSSQKDYKKLIPAVLLTLGVSAQVAANAEIFQMSEVVAPGIQLAAGEHKCGAGACGSAKSDDANSKSAEHKCAAHKCKGHKDAEHKCAAKCPGKPHKGEKKSCDHKCAGHKDANHKCAGHVHPAESKKN